MPMLHPCCKIQCNIIWRYVKTLLLLACWQACDIAQMISYLFSNLLLSAIHNLNIINNGYCHLVGNICEYIFPVPCTSLPLSNWHNVAVIVSQNVEHCLGLTTAVLQSVCLENGDYHWYFYSIRRQSHYFTWFVNQKVVYDRYEILPNSTYYSL